MIYAFLRIVKFAFQNFFRNFWLSLATLTVIVITLLLINIVITINHVKDATLAGIEQRVDISLDFKESVPEVEVLRIKSELKKDNRIDAIDLVTPEENLAHFSERYPEIGEKVLPVLDSNPLGYTLKVRAFNLNDYDSILTDLETNEDYVSRLENAQFNDLRRLTSKAATVSEKVNIGAVALAGIFFVIAFIIVFNTIRVSIYTHREEIAIMRLVGASNMFIRMPFVVESVIYSTLSVLILIGVIFVGLQFLQPVIDRFFADFAEVNLVTFYTANIWYIIGLQFAGTAVVNILSTLVALSRYLRI